MNTICHINLGVMPVDCTMLVIKRLCGLVGGGALILFLDLLVEGVAMAGLTGLSSCRRMPVWSAFARVRPNRGQHVAREACLWSGSIGAGGVSGMSLFAFSPLR